MSADRPGMQISELLFSGITLALAAAYAVSCFAV